MYINKIDDLLDKIIDDFYNIVIKNKEFIKILSELNFVKFQSKINKLLMDYEKSINRKQLEDIVSNVDNIKVVIEILKKYLAYYIFLTIGFFYNGKIETFINNIIEFSKNQPSQNLKIENFFNGESNSNIIKYNILIKNVTTLLSSEQTKLAQLAKNPKFVDAINFLNALGQEYVTKVFKLDNLGGDKKDQCHNIIKTLVIKEIYIKQDKKDIFQILEAAEKEKGEYIFIDIVIPKSDYIDFNTIESVLSQKDIDFGMANEIYDFILSSEDLGKSKELSPNDKILELINNRIIIPISDDFLLYHKDTERYEKIASRETKKKKDDTKIRYIVSKIDRITEYYSEAIQQNPKTKKELEKLFYLPLSNRKAILVNNNEEIKIIKKLQNQGIRSIENNEYYNDLVNFRMYPYINFKDFLINGFTFNANKTIDVVRYVTFEKINKQKLSDKIQLRVGSNNQALNIVGFMIPTNTLSLHCINTNNINNVRSLSYKIKKSDKVKKYDNGYAGTLKFIKHTLLKNKRYSKSIFWIFNLKQDVVQMDNYVQLDKANEEQQVKLTVSKLYDDILFMMYKMIEKQIKKKKSIKFHDFKRMINHMDRKLFEFPKDSLLYNDLEHIVFHNKYIKTKKKYDKNEDLFHGLHGDIIKLPTAPTQKQTKIQTISLRQVAKEKEDDTVKSEAEKVGAICQHFITWEKMSAIRKKNPNKFSTILFKFINQYIIENQEDDYVCKSCGTQVNLKNFVNDGAYDDDGRFITFSMPMEVPLEDVPEYEKYKPIIRHLEKQIERIASVSNMHYFLGTGTSVKWRKRGVIKDVIDLVIIHNKNLKYIYKERNEKSIGLYGINKEMTNLFVFELENSIFMHSSKDKDYYKPIKHNNVLLYVLLVMILELNDSQIIFMGGDKICNYYFFEKYGYALFNELKIRKNNKNDIVPIQNYKLLCYILYFASCMVTKYNMWFYETEDKKAKSMKFNPLIQKIIIHTMVDLMNSIVEFYGKKKRHHLYDIISMKMFTKLNTTFSNNDILNKIKNNEQKKIVTDQGKKKYAITKIKSINLSNIYEPGSYNGIVTYNKCIMAKMYLRKRNYIYMRYYRITNLSNCEVGTFHNWKPKGKTMICTICNKQLSTIKNNSSETENSVNGYKILKLKKLANRYCKSGYFHTFIYDIKLDCNICKKCKFLNPDKMSNTDLTELEKNIFKFKKYTQKKQGDALEKKSSIRKKKESRRIKFINSLKSEYGKSKFHKEDYYGFVKRFINNIEHLIGKDININSKNIYLKYDAYTINHDHNGYKLDKPIIIIEKDNKIIYKKNHPFFKTDVIFYTNYKIGKIDIYYNSTTLLLLGYKEQNKEYSLSKVGNKHMIINYSILNKLKYLGYPSKFINIEKRAKELKEERMGEDEQIIVKDIVSEISRKRIKKLKKVITDIQRYLYRIKYDFDDNIVKEFDTSLKSLDQIDIVAKHKNKTSKMILKNSQTKEKVFKGWSAIKYSLFFQELTNKTINLNTESNYFLADDINLYDYNGNIILYYIIEELYKLITINTNKFIKISIIYMILDIIDGAHNIFNKEIRTTDSELKRFNYILSSRSYIYNVEEKGHGLEGDTDGFYGEYKDADDPDDPDDVAKREEAQEEIDAIDMDVDMDYEIDYLDGVNMNTKFSNE
jgi:hypothetical protein